MTNFKAKLIENLKKEGKAIDPEVIDYFIARPEAIKDQEFSMYFPYLKTNLAELHLNYYGKPLTDKEIIKSCIKSIVREFGHLSDIEIRYCFKMIVNGTEEINKYSFNTSDLLRIIRKYDFNKISVRNAYFRLKAETKQNEEFTREKNRFIERSVHKLHNKEHLTYYERSAIGKFYVNKIEEAEIEKIKEEAESKIEEEGKGRKFKIDFALSDPEMNVPIAYTFSLVFGNLLFNRLYPNYETE